VRESGDGGDQGGPVRGTDGTAVSDFTPTAASIIESIKFTRFPGVCEFSDRHSQYQIRWTDPHGIVTAHHVFWCDHPLCDFSQTRWRLSTSPPEVKLTAWIGPDATFRIPHIAAAYLLLTFDREGRKLPQMIARIGICDQWQDRFAGNVGEPGERRLFTERYFAESGPGVYPATIEDKS
jgi:hypothetical protein